MFYQEQQFYKLPTVLRKLEQMAGTSFATLIENGSADPMTEIANIIAAEHAGEGYSYGLHSDNAAFAYNKTDAVAVRMKDGHGVIVDPDNFDVADPDHKIDEMTPLDCVLFATAVKTSLAGFYMLVRYDLLACYANPYLKTNDSIWDFYEGIECECRSTVIDVRDMSVASLPYYKFRNLNETEAYDLDHVRDAIAASGGHIIATEKLDGSMIQMRYVDDPVFEHGLLYSTSGTLSGSPEAADNEHLKALYDLHLNGTEMERHLGLAKAYPHLTFVFEFVHPQEDRHVVVYDKSREGLYLTGARDVGSGRLLGHREIKAMAAEYGIPVPQVLATDIDEALALQRDGGGSACEGMVVNVGDDLDRDGSGGWLVKVKLDGFLELSHIYHEIEGAAGFKAIGKMALDGTVDDALPILPDGLRDYVKAVVSRYEGLDEDMRSVFDDLAATGLAQANGSRKEYAVYVNGLAIPGIWRGWLFQTAFGEPIEHFWADKKGTEYRFLAQREFEEREAALTNWLAEV